MYLFKINVRLSTFLFYLMPTQADDRVKRFNYLLEQTELFGHFMSASTSKSPKKIKLPTEKRKRHPSEGASTWVCPSLWWPMTTPLFSRRRHRMSEADEDDDLLEDELNDTAITHFNENPFCKSRDQNNSCNYINNINNNNGNFKKI